jgi:hypothetical protein
MMTAIYSDLIHLSFVLVLSCRCPVPIAYPLPARRLRRLYIFTGPQLAPSR